MATSQRIALGALLVLLLGGIAGSAQNTVPGPDQAGVFAAIKAMHADLKLTLEANTRAQIVIARLATQDARVTAATTELAEAQRRLRVQSRERTRTEAEIRSLTQSLARQDGDLRVATTQTIADNRRALQDFQHREQDVRSQFARAQQALGAEQARRNGLDAKLDELERALPAINPNR